MTTPLTSETILLPSALDLASEKHLLLSDAHALVVCDKASHEQGLLLLKNEKRIEDAINSRWEGPKASAHRLHKFLTDGLKDELAPALAAKAEINRKLNEYEIAEKRRADEEARRNQEAARKAEEERKLQEAVEAEGSGDQSLAEAIIAEPVVVPVLASTPEVAAVKGVGGSGSNWKAEVVDLLALVKYVAANPEWITLLKPAEVELNSLARAQRKNLKIPGVQAVEVPRQRSVRA